MDKMCKEEMIDRLLEVVKCETKPAIGCTEPVAVALAAATARKYLKEDFKEVNVKVSKNIFKNGKSVTIPNTHECGIGISAAIGVICGDSDSGLLVFKNVNDDYVKKAEEMIEKNMVKVSHLNEGDSVYVEVNLVGENNSSTAIIRGGHTNLEKIIVNDEIIFQKEAVEDKKVDSSFIKELTVAEIKEVAENIEIEKLEFIKDGINMNKKAAEEGLKKSEGLKWGVSLLNLQKEGVIAKDSANTARILTAAGADLRMSGGNYPIMTSGGSGNQGLGVILPIVVVAEEKNIPEEKVLRAVFFAHLINLYVKKHTGKLSAMCGCAIAAGIASSVGITWMLGGNEEQIEGTVQNMLANLTGMVCDGAKESCAIKLSTSSAEAVLSAYLSLHNTVVPVKTGIIGNNVEKTIENLEVLCNNGFTQVDDAMIDISCNQ